MATVGAWHSGAMASMQTHRRRDLRPRRQTLSASALRLLRHIDTSPKPLGFPRELVESSGIRQDWAWSAMLQLQEAGLVSTNDHGHVRITRSGVARARNAA